MQRHEIFRQIIDSMSDREVSAYIYGYAMAKDDRVVYHEFGTEYFQLHARSEAVFILGEDVE